MGLTGPCRFKLTTLYVCVIVFKFVVFVVVVQVLEIGNVFFPIKVL